MLSNSVDSTQALLLAASPASTNALGVLPGLSVDKATTANFAAFSLGSAAISQSGSLSGFKPRDVYSFSAISDGFPDGQSNINLSLHDIAGGGGGTADFGADLFLFRDSNVNGVLDGGDTQVAQGTTGSFNLTSDEVINVRVNPGDYFAVVDRYVDNADNPAQTVLYQLDLSAANPSNLLPNEFNIGPIPVRYSRDGSYPDDTKVVATGTSNNQNTSDLYAFTVPRDDEPYQARVSLSGLSNDADLRVIADRNGNQIFDSGDEVIGQSVRVSNLSEEVLFDPYSADNFIAQVYQFSGDTNYTISFQAITGLG